MKAFSKVTMSVGTHLLGEVLTLMRAKRHQRNADDEYHHPQRAELWGESLATLLAGSLPRPYLSQPSPRLNANPVNKPEPRYAKPDDDD